MPFDARLKPPESSGPKLSPRPLAPRGAARRAFGPALVAACLLGAPAGAQAQETVIIGGGPAAAPLGAGGGVVSPLGDAGPGIVINDSVLNSLGSGIPAAGLPMAAPQTPVYGGAAPPAGTVAGGAPGAQMPGAYRLPDSGQLVVTRPSTLLFPPMKDPRSRLAVPPARAAQAKPAPSGSGGKLPSRLIAAPPKRPSAEPSAPSMASTPQMVAPETAAAPQMAKQSAPVPAMPEAPVPGAAKAAASAAAPAAARPSVPPPPSLARDLSKEAATTAAGAKIPAIAATIAPKPNLPASSTQSAVAPPAPPKPPAVPRIAAPTVAVPARQTPAAPAQPPAQPTAQPTAVQDAALTTGVTAPPAGADFSLVFKAGSAELSEAAKAELRGLAKTLGPDGSGRVQLLAFAADDGEGTSKARRLSLSRALAVRAFLIDQGVRSTRMDVRALGSNAGDGPADRVDVLPQ